MNEWYAKKHTHTHIHTSQTIIARGKYMHLKSDLFHCYHYAQCALVSLPYVFFGLIHIEICPLVLNCMCNLLSSLINGMEQRE